MNASDDNLRGSDANDRNKWKFLKLESLSKTEAGQRKCKSEKYSRVRTQIWRER